MSTKLQVKEAAVEVSERQPWRDGLGVGIAAVAVGALSIMAVYGELFVEVFGFLAIFALLGALAARNDSRALRWGIAALMTIFVGINAIYAVVDLSHPESPGPFIATAVVVVSGIATIGLAVLSARGRVVPVRRVWLGVAAVLVVAAVGSIAAAAAVEDGVAQPGDVTIVAKDIRYPDQVVITPDAEGLLVSNRDGFRHNFVIDGEVSAVELPANTDVRIALDGLEPGAYRFHCSVVGHENMEGQLIVE